MKNEAYDADAYDHGIDSAKREISRIHSIIASRSAMIDSPADLEEYAKAFLAGFEEAFKRHTKRLVAERRTMVADRRANALIRAQTTGGYIGHFVITNSAGHRLVHSKSTKPQFREGMRQVLRFETYRAAKAIVSELGPYWQIDLVVEDLAPHLRTGKFTVQQDSRYLTHINMSESVFSATEITPDVKRYDTRAEAQEVVDQMRTHFQVVAEVVEIP